MKPIISIIIPAYNSENTILSTLSSIYNQSFQDYEIILVDDGSTDDTASIISCELKNGKKIVYRFQENSGVSSARNHGLDIAKGSYITFLDSDDSFEPSFLEEMYHKICEKNSEICYCGYNILSPTGKRARRSHFTGKNVLRNYILEKTTISTLNWLIDANHLKMLKLKFQEGVSWGEDVEFFAELLSRSTKITYVDQYLSNYHVGFYDDNLSSYSVKKIDKDFESIFRMINNPSVGGNKQIKKMLLNYRLPALIVYNLNSAFENNIELAEILEYFYKYKKHIIGISYVNGLRSIKLNLARLKFMLLMFKNKNVKDLFK